MLDVPWCVCEHHSCAQRGFASSVLQMGLDSDLLFSPRLLLVPAFAVLDLSEFLHLLWALTGRGSDVYLRGVSLALGWLAVLLWCSLFLQWHLLGERSMAGSSAPIPK